MPEDGKPGEEPIKMEAPPAYEPWINEFLVWVQLEKGLSENTINSYETDLNQCACFLDQQNVPHWKDAGLEHFSAWMSSLTDGEYAVASLARKLSALANDGPLLVGEGKLGENHTELLGNPKKKKNLTPLSDHRRNGKNTPCSRFKHTTREKRSSLIGTNVREWLESL